MAPREFALPGTKSRYAPDRQSDISHIKLDVDIDVEQRRISGTCSLTLSPIARDVRWVRLDAVEMEIERVDCDCRPCSFSYDGRVLRIDLGRSLNRGEEVICDVVYSTRPRRGLYFVGPEPEYPEKPIQVWSQGQDEDSRFWFPCFDSPHEKATSEVIVTLPAQLFALSNGALVSDVVDGDRRTIHWRFDTPHSCYLITLAAGELAEIADRWEDIDVCYYVAKGREEDCRRTLSRTPEMLELFSHLFGVRYPYGKYAQVFVSDFIFGGMENTTATTLTDTVLIDERAALDWDAEALVAHELAHQWFGDLITCRDWGQGWLNEGFATYSEYLWREHAHGRDNADVELEEWAEQYFGEDSARYRRTIATNVYDEPIDIFDHHLYEKGGRVLHMLRAELGDLAFWKAIAHYLSKHRAGVVETRDLARAVEEATGRVLDWFFDQWVIRGSGHPELEVEYSWDPDAELASFTVKQTHEVKGTTPLFRLPAKIRLRVKGKDRDVDALITDAQHHFFFSCESEPEQAIFDPGKVLLAKVKTKKGAALWQAELEGAALAIDRVYAARELGKHGGIRAAEGLIAALRGDSFWWVRGEAATALGKLRTDRARDALIEAVDSTSNPKARRAVVRALGEYRGDHVAAAALARIISDGDPSYFVEAEACLSLGKTRSPRAPELLREAAERDSFTDVIRQHAYRGLAEARDHSALPLLLEATAYGRVSQGRRAALGAAAQLVAGHRDRAAADVRERCMELLGDKDFRIQAAAIEALATLTDPRAIEALQDLADRDLDGRLRRRAREVIRDLREGTAQAEELERLRDELDKLRAASLELRERLDKLESSQEGGVKKAKKAKKQSAKKKPGKKKAKPNKKK